jgi:hypothetical protein
LAASQATVPPPYTVTPPRLPKVLRIVPPTTSVVPGAALSDPRLRMFRLKALTPVAVSRVSMVPA